MADPNGSVRALSDWLGGTRADWPAVAALADGDALVACYYVAGVELARTRHEKPYLKLRLHDRNGAVDGRVWDDAERFADRVRPGSYVGVRGRVQVFNGGKQLKIEDLARVRVSPEELPLFLPRSSRDPDEMARELEQLIRSVQDRPLRALLRRLLDESGQLGRAFRHAPAAKHNHHACVGGLLEHTISVAAVCDVLARHYGTGIDRDLLVAGALLHDIGKTREIAVEAGFPYTDQGKLLGHILLGLQLVADAAARVPELSADRLLLLQHLIASHQGKYEWQSPREPRLLEALLLHYADDMDAKVFQARALLDAVDAGWSAYDRGLGRDFLRHRLADDEPPDATHGQPLDAEPPAAPRALDLFTED